MTNAEIALNSARLSNFAGLSMSREEAATLAARVKTESLPEVVAEVKKLASSYWWVPVAIGGTGLAWVGLGSYLTRRRRRR